MDNRPVSHRQAEERAKSLPGIEELNTLQRAALQSDARQLVMIAPTGSGKTIAFGLCVLRVLRGDGSRPQAVIIAPSRELVMQIASVMRMLAKGFKTVALYGGHSMADETASLTPMPDVVVATPGRFLDHLQRGTLALEGNVGALVLDEYDKALQLGFEAEMKRIVKRIGVPRRFVLTSATMLEPVPSYLGLDAPELIEAEADKKGAIEVVTVESYSRDKLDSLLSLLQTSEVGSRAIVFVNHRESAERVCSYLRGAGVAAGLYHGALDQQQRVMAVDLFANGTTPVLVATDLAARGLDIKAVDSVIHYHLPVDEAAWVHRNGRTARQGASGKVFVIHSDADDMPDYIVADRPYNPSVSDAGLQRGIRSDVATLYFKAGKKEKISKGDILGFILANSDLEARQVGRIDVHDHFSLAAVPSAQIAFLAKALGASKLKGKRVKVTIVN